MKKYCLWCLYVMTIFCIQPLPVLAKTAGKHTDKHEMVPFFWLLAAVGSCIVIVLLYVSWKKYREEIKKKNCEHTDDI